MLNLYEEIRSKPYYNKIEIGGLLFAEYTCPIDVKSLSIWTHTDYLVHVVSGKKIWHTPNGLWKAEAGQTLFFKKGAAVVEQDFDEDFCLLLFFIPDNFVRETLNEFPEKLIRNSFEADLQDSAIRVNNDTALSLFFQSMHSYFSKIEKPSESVMKLKLKELILNILESRNNPELSSYFNSLKNNRVPSISNVMEANFRYNLALEDFAELCNRSLSSFKRDFQKVYNESPGKWLLNKRLEYSAALLSEGDLNISQITFESGFEDLSHFCRAFKNKFGMPPSKFRVHTTVST